jgi:SAM-dependent methyltransferase
MSLLDPRNDVVGLDILPSMIDGMNDCIQSMRARGVVFNLTAASGDICNPQFGFNSFNAIYSIEAIEHVHDTTAMFHSCFDLLRPGGTIILLNDQNIYNVSRRDETLAMWEKREHDWSWSEYLKSIRPIEHANARPFRVMREEIVTKANPRLSADQVTRVVDSTAGLLKKEIMEIALDGGKSIATRPPYDWCRNPETGEYAERLFDPFKLCEDMQRAGFVKAGVRHMFRRLPLSLANAVGIRPINRLLFNIRPVFLLFGQKP